MEDKYKVVCALSNSATFNDFEWPRTPVSSLQDSLKAKLIDWYVHIIPCSHYPVRAWHKVENWD